MTSPNRPVLSQPTLYAHLIGEFNKLRPAACARCRIPLPFWGPGVGTSTGYWYMPAPGSCLMGCHQVIATLWANVTTEYELAPPLRVVPLPFKRREKSVA